MIKKCETCGIAFKLHGCFLKYTNHKDDLINKNMYVLTKIMIKCLTKS